MAAKSITHRWIINGFGAILAVIVALEIIIAVVIKNYYYESVKQQLILYSQNMETSFNRINTGTEQDFQQGARKILEDFEDKNKIELMVMSSSGKFVMTSSGFMPDNDITPPDFNEAKDSEKGRGYWSGNLQTGEKVMAYTNMIRSSDKDIGAVRYLVSLTNVDKQVFVSIVILIIIGCAIIVFMIISGSYFIGSIINPIRDINVSAKRIAMGDFKVRLKKRYDDEVGDLCDTINYMAGALGETEDMKNEFISSVSHELRTPLTAIKGWAETLEQINDTEMQKKGLAVISKETERLAGLVEELLDFSRMQRGKTKYNFTQLDIVAELSEAVFIFEQRAKSEGITLYYNEPEASIPVMGDRNRLKQVFINILDNAIKYSKKDGSVNVSIEDKGGLVFVCVNDNGIGIEEKDLPKVKEKFYKGNTQIRGSGIGLAVAEEICNVHKGSLTIKSTYGKGTTVMVELPKYIPNVSPMPEQTDKAVLQQAPSNSDSDTNSKEK